VVWSVSLLLCDARCGGGGAYLAESGALCGEALARMSMGRWGVVLSRRVGQR
jgi:hypothetical protein